MTDLKFYTCISVKNKVASIVYLNKSAIKKAQAKKNAEGDLRMNMVCNDLHLTIHIAAYVRCTQSGHSYRDVDIKGFTRRIKIYTRDTGCEYRRDTILIVKATNNKFDEFDDILPGDFIVAAVGQYAEGVLKTWADSLL